jgi:DHA1 family tetracycline resistance protein-like MFS transporter
MKKYALYTVFLTVFLDILGFGLIIPLLPFYAQKFGANEFIIGTLLASNAVAQFIFNPIWGRISDKFGRRPVMLVTVLGSGIAYLLLAWQIRFSCFSFQEL